MKNPIQLPGRVCLTGEEYRELMAKLAEKDEQLEMIEAGYAGLQYEMNKQLAEKDKWIAELDKENEQLVVLCEEVIKKKDKRIGDMLQNCDYKSGICTKMKAQDD